MLLIVRPLLFKIVLWSFRLVDMNEDRPRFSQDAREAIDGFRKPFHRPDKDKLVFEQVANLARAHSQRMSEHALFVRVGSLTIRRLLEPRLKSREVVQSRPLHTFHARCARVEPQRHDAIERLANKAKN